MKQRVVSLRMWIKENKLDKLLLLTNPVGSITPIPDIDPSKKTLKAFYWFDYLWP